MANKKTTVSRSRERPVGRLEILDAARAIAVRNGWNAMTIRAVASKLGYSSPLLYEHFRDKKDLLTQIAVDAVTLLQASLAVDLPKASRPAAVAMIGRYWMFMLKNAQLYRLMNGMDGTLIDNKAVGRAAQSLCKFIAARLRPLAGKNATQAYAMILTEELWALLHGMAALHLHRSVPFDLKPGR
jgi:AcrR family transcriptional regulator